MSNIIGQLVSQNESTAQTRTYLAVVEGTVENSQGTIRISELTVDGASAPTTAVIATTVYGDTAPLQTNDVVAVIDGAVPIIVGVVSSDSEYPEHEQTERVIHHEQSDAEIRLREDGSVVINADSCEIQIDGETQLTLTDTDISLGAGDSPIARKGDSVSVNTTTGEGTITEGSNTVSSE